MQFGNMNKDLAAYNMRLFAERAAMAASQFRLAE
jgi:hypothetical protein